MKLQISPIDFVVALPFYWIAFIAIQHSWRRAAGRPIRWGLVLAAPGILVLPIADEFWIAWNFERACREEAGVHVYRKVEAEGFFDGTGSPGTGVIEELGFRYAEGLTQNGKAVAHVERVKGLWHRTILDRPQSRYHYRWAVPEQSVQVGHQLWREELQVIDVKSGEVLGDSVRFARYPAWLQGLWVRFFGSAVVTCWGSPAKQTMLYHYVLIPKKSD